MIISHNKSKCIGCGVCTVLCPDYFKMQNDKACLKGSKTKPGSEIEELEVKEVKDCVHQAVDACPVRCIKIIKK